MEAVGLTASIISIAQLTGKLTSLTYEYYSGFKKAPKDIRGLANELHSLSIVLESLRDFATANPQSPVLQKLNTVNGPIPLFLKELTELHLKLSATNTSSIAERFKWVFKEKDNAQLVLRIEQHKSLFTFALNADHISLSKAIEAYVINIDHAAEYIKAHVRDMALAVQEIKEDAKNTSLTVQGIKTDVGDTCTAIQNLQSESVAQSAWRNRKDIAENMETYVIVLAWLYSEPFETKHVEISGRRRENTGEWLLNSPEFRELVKNIGDSFLLWGYGIPGAGKTFLSSAAIDYLHGEAKTKKYGVAYIYFDYNEQNQQKPFQVLASLVKQLVGQTSQLPTYISDLQIKCTKEAKRPTQQELYLALVSTLKSFSRVFFIFDALDECSQKLQRKELLPLFHRMVKENRSISMFITSRQYPEDIQVSFRDSAKIELRANDEDIKLYIESKIDENPRAKRLVGKGNFKEEMISRLTKCANGMFLLVHFHIELICQQPTLKKILKELERLSLENSTVGSSEKSPLDPTYDRAMKTIHAQAGGCVELATKIFTWLVKARRTLTVDELRTAVSVEPDLDELEDEDLPDRATLLDVCAGLVMIDEKSDTIRFVHYTVQEYILKLSLIPEDANISLAMACTTFLSLDIFAKGACTSNELLKSRIEANPFLRYAALQLPFHLSLCDEALSTESVLKFLNLGSIDSYLQVNFCIQDLYYSIDRARMGYYEWYPKQLPLHVASAIGHRSAVQILIEQGANVLIPDIEGNTALHHAARNGHEAVVRLLIDNGANVSEKCGYENTALHKAARNGHEAVVRLLIDNGANVSEKGECGNTALHDAASNGHEAVIQLLIDNGANVSEKDKYQDTALHKAASNGHEAVIQLLIDNGANVSEKDEYQGTALHKAASNGHEAVVRLLIDNDANVSEKKSYQDTALHDAASNGHEAVIQLLIDNGANVSEKGYNQDTALHKAASNGHEAVVRLLIDNGANVSEKNSYQDTALHYAASNGHEAVIQLLIDNGANVSEKDEYQDTALHDAASSGHKAVVRLFIDNGANVSEKNSYQDTALHYAASNGHEAVIQLLIDNGANVSEKGQNQDTALHKAASNGHEAVIQLLIDNGVNVSEKGQNQETALHKAASNRHEAVIQLLIDNGANVSEKGQNQDTALHKAAINGHEAVIQLLIDNGANVSEKGQNQETALHKAASNRHEAVARLLIDNGADISSRDEGGNSILDRAVLVRYPNQSLIQSLLENNALPSEHINQAILKIPGRRGEIASLLKTALAGRHTAQVPE